MNVKALFEIINGSDIKNHEGAIKDLATLFDLWKKEDSFELLKLTIDREVDLCINQTDLSEGAEKVSMSFGYLKGLKTVLNRLEWYSHSAVEITEKDRKEAEEKEENGSIEDSKKFVAGLETSPNSGLSSIVR